MIWYEIAWGMCVTKGPSLSPLKIRSKLGIIRNNNQLGLSVSLLLVKWRMHHIHIHVQISVFQDSRFPLLSSKFALNIKKNHLFFLLKGFQFPVKKYHKSMICIPIKKVFQNNYIISLKNQTWQTIACSWFCQSLVLIPILILIRTRIDNTFSQK